MDLYEASVSDLSQALLQSTKAYTYSKGRYHGSGPSAMRLAEKVKAQGNLHPRTIDRIVSDSVQGTPLQGEINSTQERVGQTKRRKQPKIIHNEEQNATHRPDIMTGSSNYKRQRHEIIEESTDILETNLHKTMWAIRRIPKGGRVKCQGWLGAGQGKCQKHIPNRGGGAVAPSFWGVRVWGGGQDQASGMASGSKAQYMWFCPDSVDHTWQPSTSILHAPPRVPNIWPVQEGTSITIDEILKLEKAGFNLQHKAPKEMSRETRQRMGVSEAAARRIESVVKLEATILEHEVVKENVHERFKLQTTTSMVLDQAYDVHISKNPTCTCPDFSLRMAQGQAYVACKHIYFVYLRVFGMDVNHNLCIHQARLESEELYRIFQCRRTF